MVAVALNPVLMRPREYLSDHQVALLRALDLHGPAVKVRGGWMLGGHYRKAATMKPLEALNLAAPTYRWGKHRLEPTITGRAVVQALAPQSKSH